MIRETIVHVRIKRRFRPSAGQSLLAGGVNRHRGGNQGRARVADGIQNVRLVDDAEPGAMYSPTDANAAITAGTGAMFHVHRRRPSVRQLEQVPRMNQLVVARCTLCTGQSSAIMTHVGAMYSAPDAGAAHQLELVSTRQKGCQDCGPLSTTVWLLKPASQDLAHRNYQTLSNCAQTGS